jgi:hypothetical protein
MILDKIQKYGWMAAAITAASLLGLQTWRLHSEQLQHAALKVEVAAERQAAAQANANQHAQFRKTEINLANDAAASRKDTHGKVSSLNDQRDRLLVGSRSMRGQSSGTSGIGTGTAAAVDRQAGPISDGTGLHGPAGAASAVFDVDEVNEAFRADLIRIHLLACYRDYDRAQAALKRLAEQGANE